MIIKDTNHIPKHKKMLDELFSYKIQIGIFGDKGLGATSYLNETGTTELLLVANVNEFGCQIKVTEKMRNYLRAIGLPLRNDTEYINIPERSYIRSGWDDRLSKIEEKAIFMLKQILLEKVSPYEGMDKLGDYVAGQLKDYMTDLSSPPNHPFTLERKSPKSNPLMNSGRLRQSITHKVVRI